MPPVLFPPALALALALCAGNVSAQSATGEPLRLYDSTQIGLDRYTVVRRLGIDGWESAFRVRGHDDLESAQRAMFAEAARFGADGVINLVCLDQTDRLFNRAGYFCYGNAIKLKQ